MQSDLFTHDSPNEIQYAEALAKIVKKEEDCRIEQGIIAPWIEADFLLAKDERRLLELVDEHSGYLIHDDDWHISAYGESGARRVSGFTVAMGMQAEANSKAVLNSAIDRGLVTISRNNAAYGNMVDMTRLGRYYLDLLDTDQYWESEESE